MSENGSGVTEMSATAFYAGAFGALLVIGGAFLPWARTQTRSWTGIQIPAGIITVVIGVVLVGFFLFGSYPRRGMIAGGGICALVGLGGIDDPMSLLSFTVSVVQSRVYPGIGLYLTTVGGLVLLASGVYDYETGGDTAD